VITFGVFVIHIYASIRLLVWTNVYWMYMHIDEIAIIQHCNISLNLALPPRCSVKHPSRRGRAETGGGLRIICTQTDCQAVRWGVWCTPPATAYAYNIYYITPCVESASFPYNYFDVITISTFPWTNKWLGDWNERKRRGGGGRYQDRYMRRHRWGMAVWKAVGVRRKSERRRARTSVGERDGRDVTFATKVSILNATPQVSNRTPRDF